MIKYLTKEDNFLELIKEGNIIIDFYADWCGPCRILGEQLEKLNLDNITVMKVNTDTFSDLAREYSVMSIPNMLFFKDGQLVKSVVGYRTKSEMEKLINELFV